MNDFSEIIKNRRRELYPTAKAFCTDCSLPFTYYYYSKIESGFVPTASNALELIKLLDVDMKSTMLAWLRAQIDDPAISAIFGISNDTFRSFGEIEQEEIQIINRMQAKLLRKNSVYWELVTFLNCHSGEVVSIEEISISFDISRDVVKKKLSELYDFGLVDADESGGYRIKKWSMLPDEEEYNELRKIFFVNCFEKSYFRPNDLNFGPSLITKSISNDQQRLIRSKIKTLNEFIVDLPDSPAECEEIFSIGIFFGPRKFGGEGK